MDVTLPILDGLDLSTQAADLYCVFASYVPIIVVAVTVFEALVRQRGTKELSGLLFVGCCLVQNELCFKHLLNSPRPPKSCACTYGMPSSHATICIGLLVYSLGDTIFLLGGSPLLQHPEPAECLSLRGTCRFLWRCPGRCITFFARPLRPEIEVTPRMAIRWFTAWLLLLGTVPLCRVTLHDHSPAQVLAGSVIGIVNAIVGFCITRRFQRKCCFKLGSVLTVRFQCCGWPIRLRLERQECVDEGLEPARTWAQYCRRPCQKPRWWARLRRSGRILTPFEHNYALPVCEFLEVLERIDVRQDCSLFRDQEETRPEGNPRAAQSVESNATPLRDEEAARDDARDTSAQALRRINVLQTQVEYYVTKLGHRYDLASQSRLLQWKEQAIADINNTLAAENSPSQELVSLNDLIAEAGPKRRAACAQSVMHVHNLRRKLVPGRWKIASTREGHQIFDVDPIPNSGGVVAFDTNRGVHAFDGDGFILKCCPPGGRRPAQEEVSRRSAHDIWCLTAVPVGSGMSLRIMKYTPRLRAYQQFLVDDSHGHLLLGADPRWSVVPREEGPLELTVWPPPAFTPHFDLPTIHFQFCLDDGVLKMHQTHLGIVNKNGEVRYKTIHADEHGAALLREADPEDEEPCVLELLMPLRAPYPGCCCEGPESWATATATWTYNATWRNAGCLGYGEKCQEHPGEAVSLHPYVQWIDASGEGDLAHSQRWRRLEPM